MARRSIILIFAIIGTTLAGPQIGIKTRYPLRTGSLVQNNTENGQNSVGGYNYNSMNNYYSGEARPVYNVRPVEPEIKDEFWKFNNETRSKMSTGICFKEVPTASLLRTPSGIPAGNGSDPTMSKIQICCEGWERNVHNFYKCDPICSNGCPNGICTAPDTCVCFPGHVRNSDQICIATCPIGCGNGVCEEDGSCKCKPGFKLDVSTKFCIPECPAGCFGGNCTAPNECTCRDHFQYRLDNGQCEPKCDSCEHGRCTAPGVCQCNKGYRRSGESCVPVCEIPCNNGICSSPNTCECLAGFTLQSAVNCVAHCDIPCMNGVCSGSNSCTCNQGYIADEFAKNVCKPHCPQGCQNGFCTSPGFCVCKLGFIKSGVKGRQQCTPI